jgi:hypothetical protein
MFLTLPNEICREIGGYLDYESRMNYNRNVELDDRFVKKLKSDEHNLQVKVNLLKSKLNRHDAMVGIQNTARSMVSIFAYLVKTKDNVLFNDKRFTTVVLARARYHSLEENIFGNDGTRPPRQLVKRLIRLAKKLVLKVENGFTSNTKKIE